MQTTNVIIEPVHIDNIGICEHCGTVLILTFAPSRFGAIMKPVCSKCKRVLSLASYGREVVVGHTVGRRVRWVGPDFKWHDTRPTKNFPIDSFYSVVGCSPGGLC